MSEDTLTAKDKLEVPAEIVGKKLSNALQGSDNMRREEEKTIFLSIKSGFRPEVVFTGFWSGKYIKAAMDSIAKAYRLHKGKNIRPQANIPNAVVNNTSAVGAEGKEK